jgi:hypothetical protein
MLLGSVLRQLHRTERSLADGFERVATFHQADSEIALVGRKTAMWSAEHVEKLAPHLDRFPAPPNPSLKLAASALFAGPRPTPVGLLNDLQELLALCNEAKLGWTLVAVAARALRDRPLLEISATLPVQTIRQVEWLESELKTLAPQVLVTASTDVDGKGRRFLAAAAGVCAAGALATWVATSRR